MVICPKVKMVKPMRFTVRLNDETADKLLEIGQGIPEAHSNVDIVRHIISHYGEKSSQGEDALIQKVAALEEQVGHLDRNNTVNTILLLNVMKALAVSVKPDDLLDSADLKAAMRVFDRHLTKLERNAKYRKGN